MELDLAALLSPVPGDDPTGPDLSYDPERQRIEAAFDSPVSINPTLGGTAPVRPQIDWAEIAGLAVALSARTKDLGLAVYLARAGVRAGRLDLVEAGVHYLAGLLETYWETVHPRLDEAGLRGRMSVCEALKQPGDFLLPLRRMILLRHARLGDFSTQDVERFAREGAEAEGYGSFRGAIDGREAEIAEMLGQFERIRDGIRRADAALSEHSDGEGSVNFAPTLDVLAAVARALGSFLPDGGGEAADADAPEPIEAAPVARRSGGGFAGGAIASREDVAGAMDAIIDYYRRSEPGSPIPVLLARARAWIGADFLEIIEDIAPGGASEVRGVLTARRTDQE